MTLLIQPLLLLNFGNNLEIWPGGQQTSNVKVTSDQVWLPILGIGALHLTHPKCTHTTVNTHTVNTHTEHWAAIYAAGPDGEQLWVRCLAQGHISHGIEGGQSAVHSLPHLQFLPDLRLNLATFGL